jgi:hypothetical protein
MSGQRVFIDEANRFQGYEFAILRRNLNPANGAPLPVLDFGSGEVVSGAAIGTFFGGFGADPFLIATTLITSNIRTASWRRASSRSVLPSTPPA